MSNNNCREREENMDDLIEYIHNISENVDFKKLLFPTFMIIIYLIGILYLSIVIKNNKVTNIESKTTIKNKQLDNTDYIYIDIKGSVKNPGVYKLNSDSRVVDAIEASGGVLEDANTRFINLSKSLNDGDVIVVYSYKEIEEAKKEEKIVIETPCICEEVKNDACYKDEDLTSDGKVNINTASFEELKSLNGIGDAKAKAIIEYRNTNGNFKSIEEIKNVIGISESLYEKIKDSIVI